MSELLFDTTKQNISLHLKNIFEDGELSPEAVVKESLTGGGDEMERATMERYHDYDRRRKAKASSDADASDDAVPKAIEDRVKTRRKQ